MGRITYRIIQEVTALENDAFIALQKVQQYDGAKKSSPVMYRLGRYERGKLVVQRGQGIFAKLSTLIVLREKMIKIEKIADSMRADREGDGEKELKAFQERNETLNEVIDDEDF